MPTIQQWIWYWLQIPGCPDGPKVGAADALLVQAFGRNHLADNDLANLRRFHDDHGSVDAVTLAWCRDNVEPGQVNRQLAWHMMNAVHRHRLTVIAQWEVIVACPRDWYQSHRDRVICLWPSATPGAYFSTREVLESSFAAMKDRHLSRPMILAHAGQAMRVAMMIQKTTGTWPVIHAQLADEYDRESVQPWTRNRFAWMVHEFLARGHHVVHHWV